MAILIGLIVTLTLIAAGLGVLTWVEQRARARRLDAMQDLHALARRIAVATAGEHAGAAKLWMGR